jgi:4-diphosphocytidyl-2-C-methyl-D-erythritol kinase
MITFPNCKINLGLNIVGRRSDGYHDLETIFYPVHLKDALEVIENNIQSSIHNIQFSTSGISIDGEKENNLCVKAFNLLKKDFPFLPGIKIHLHKAIPMGAGLGGGSADGAYTLLLLNKKFNLGLDEKQLLDYALQLGSDCPFFILNKPCHATGRGEKLEPAKIDLSAYKILIVHPGIHVSTADAFANIKPVIPSKSIKKIIHQPAETWREELKNDFEETVLAKHAEIKNIKEQLYMAGAVYASMSGSGSAVFGLFKKNQSAYFSFPGSFFVKWIEH